LFRSKSNRLCSERFENADLLPLRWLERYGNLTSTATFFFLSGSGALETLAGTD
jgi:hypothetical protein